MLCIILIVGLALYTMDLLPEAKITPMVLFCILGVMCFFPLIFMPLAVKVKEGTLTVFFSLRHRRFAIDDIETIEPYAVTMNFVRICGSGGWFGWWGWYRNQELGRFMVYATDLNKVVFLKLKNGKKYIISCTDPQSLAQAVTLHK